MPCLAPCQAEPQQEDVPPQVPGAGPMSAVRHGEPPSWTVPQLGQGRCRMQPACDGRIPPRLGFKVLDRQNALAASSGRPAPTVVECVTGIPSVIMTAQPGGWIGARMANFTLDTPGTGEGRAASGTRKHGAVRPHPACHAAQDAASFPRGGTKPRPWEASVLVSVTWSPGGNLLTVDDDHAGLFAVHWR